MGAKNKMQLTSSKYGAQAARYTKSNERYPLAIRPTSQEYENSKEEKQWKESSNVRTNDRWPPTSYTLHSLVIVPPNPMGLSVRTEDPGLP